MPIRSPLSPHFQKLFAELIGTFAMIFVGCGAIMIAATTGVLGHASVSASFGLIIMVMINATGHISGAHFNPAVTLGFASVGRFPWRSVPAYWMAQFLGATIAVSALSFILGDVASFGATSPAESVGALNAIVVEIIISFFLMFVIISVATDSRAVGPLAGLAIGSTVAVCALVGGPLTGASMNPTRSAAPALFSGQFSDLWIYFIGPATGTVLGAWCYEFIRCDPTEGNDASGCC